MRACASGTALAAGAAALVLATAGTALADTAPPDPDTVEIIRGQDVSDANFAARWPAIAALYDNRAGSAINGQFCGGTLIRPGWVLTAAHCLYDSRGRPVHTRDARVLLGQRLLTDNTGEHRTITGIAMYPTYNNSTMIYDAALLRLASDSAQPSMTEPTVADGALWSDAVGLAVGGNGEGPWVAGWGSTTKGLGNIGPDSWPDALQEVAVPIHANASCSSSTAPGIGSNFHAASMFCAGVPGNDAEDATGYDSCVGDSGGPLIAQNGGGTFRLVGLVSFGMSDFCGGSTYGAYTRVAALTSWINTVTGTDAEGTPTEQLNDPTFTDGVAGQTAVTLKWAAPAEGITPGAYRIYRITPANTRVTVANVGRDARAAKITGLAPSTTYRFAIASRGGGATSPANPTLRTVKTKADTTAPTRPGTPKLARRTRTSVTFTWAAARDNHRVAKYLVHQYKGGRWVQLGTTRPGTRKFTAGKLRRNTGYRFSVVAVDPAGNRTRSRTSIFKTAA